MGMDPDPRVKSLGKGHCTGISGCLGNEPARAEAARGMIHLQSS